MFLFEIFVFFLDLQTLKQPDINDLRENRRKRRLIYIIKLCYLNRVGFLGRSNEGKCDQN
ncbi:hypothetical protein ACB098_09G174100 [Castanea mollissima]